MEKDKRGNDHLIVTCNCDCNNEMMIRRVDFDEKCIEQARQRVEDFGFDLKPFDAAVVKMQTRISEE